jgi:hypothetical protein
MVQHWDGRSLLRIYSRRGGADPQGNVELMTEKQVLSFKPPPRFEQVALLVWMIRLWPSLLSVAQVVQPKTILRWHRTGFKAFWCWKSRKRVLSLSIKIRLNA